MRHLQADGQRADATALQAGEVGYFTASIKNVKDTRVGDTVTDAANPAAEALPGYRQASPWSTAASTPRTAASTPTCGRAGKAAAERRLSLTFEPETSVALGFGFRCGFLGMLHMEIIQERLEREFDLDLITTLPSVIYHVYKTDGTMVKVDNPTTTPTPAHRARRGAVCQGVDHHAPGLSWATSCPCVRSAAASSRICSIWTPTWWSCITRCRSTRSSTTSSTAQGRTKGYASLDYELTGYRTSDLVKVDMLLNGDQVDALSFIAHRDKAYPRARLCEKLKENIPAPAVRGADPGGHRRQDHRPRDGQGHAQGRAGQVLRRRHHP